MLFKKAFEVQSRINLDDYTVNSEGKITWSISKLKKDENGRKIKAAIEEKFGEIKTYHTVSSEIYLALMNSRIFGLRDKDITKKAEKLREIEKKGRNKAAHQIVSIDDKFLKRETGFTSEEILNKITDFAEEIKLGVKKEHWNSYEIMNEKIINSLN